MEGNGRVFWTGPLTVEEIKCRLALKRSPNMIGRRATISDSNPSRLIYSDCPLENHFIKQQFFESSDVGLSDSFISEYLTSNETMPNDDSVITNTTYTTCLQSNQTSAKDDGITLDSNRSFQNCNNTIEDMEQGGSCPSQYVSAVESNLDSPKHDVYLPQPSSSIGESQYLNRINDTIFISSDDDDDDEGEISEISNDESVLETSCNNILNNGNCSSIYISSDPDCSFEVKMEKISLNVNEQFLDNINLDAPNVFLSNSQSTDMLSQPSVSDENNIDTHLHDLDTPIGISEVVIENISSSPLQESSEFCFNDTLEEMEMALKYGLDYSMPDEVAEKNIPQQDLSSKPKLSSAKLKKTLIPVQSTQLKKQAHKSISPVNLPSRKEDFNFKMPSKIAVSCKKPNLKNVFSPVATYIKNSPKVPLVQHIPAKPFISGPLFSKPQTSSTISNKENQELPCRIYKPSKRVIETQEKEIKLPVSLAKYISNTPTIIKHQGRIAAKKTNSIDIEEKLLQDDLTMCSSDESFFNSSQPVQDISYRTAKKTYIN